MTTGLIEAPQSLYSTVPWLSRRWALPTTAGLLFMLNAGLTIAMLVVGMFHVDYFTYWNWTVTTLWLLGIATLFPFGGWPSTLFTKWTTPLVVGMAALTMSIIWVVVAIDDRVYIGGTAADSTTTKPKWTFSEIRTGDWIVHGLPLFEILLVYLFDFQLYFRAIIYHWERSDSWYRRWWYWLWVYVSPMLPIGLYSIIFDPREKYTKELSLTAGLAIAGGLNLLVMTLFTLSVRLKENHAVSIGDFYADILHVSRMRGE